MDTLQLSTICGSVSRAQKFAAPLTAAMREFGINDPREQCMFIAQVMHESMGLVYTTECASGKAYDTGSLAKRLGNTPEADGDGQRYKGRGLIQITGKANYLRCGRALGVDLLAQPELLSDTVLACRSAAWFWKDAGCAILAAPYTEAAMIAVTKRINGGTNGLADRLTRWSNAKRFMGVL